MAYLRTHRMIGIDSLIPKVTLESEIGGLDQKLLTFDKLVQIKYKLYLGHICYISKVYLHISDLVG